MAGNGGPRPNSGRKPGDTVRSRSDINDFLKRIWERNDKVQLVTECLQAKETKAYMLVKLMEWEYGKPTAAEAPSADGYSFTDDVFSAEARPIN